MFRLIRLFRTSIGSKLLMAVSGLLLFGFVLGHMLGNLTILIGPNALNGYAAWLQGHPLLWVFRIILLLLAAMHLVTAVRLWLGNRRARPVGYRAETIPSPNRTARWAVFSGVLFFLFLVYHLLQLTGGVVGPELSGLFDAQGRVDVYARVVTTFQQPLLSTVYLAGVGLLGLHLMHGLPSLLQTLGFNHESYEGLIRAMAVVVTLLIVAGFAAIPLLVLAGQLLPRGGA